jgi:TetR/AcrR family transcriptional repressor of nem operon
MAVDGPNRAEILAAATEVFWRAGFEDAKIEDVVQATGLNRYSLYSAFGGKRELFLAALEAYHARGRDIFFGGLNDQSVAPLDAIRRVCEWAIGEMAERRTGCLIHNVAADQAQTDELVAERIAQYTVEIERAFAMALERASARGELAPGLDPARGARHLLIMKLGIGDFARAGASREEMLDVLESGISLMRARPGEGGTGKRARSKSARVVA